MNRLEISYRPFSVFSHSTSHLTHFNVTLRCVLIIGFHFFSSDDINKMISSNIN